MKVIVSLEHRGSQKSGVVLNSAYTVNKRWVLLVAIDEELVEVPISEITSVRMEG